MSDCYHYVQMPRMSLVARHTKVFCNKRKIRHIRVAKSIIGPPTYPTTIVVIRVASLLEEYETGRIDFDSSSHET